MGKAVTGAAGEGANSGRGFHRLVFYALELLLAGAACFAAAKLDALLAGIYSVPVPISAAAGLGFAAVMLRGFRLWPAVFVAAFVAAFPSGIEDLGFADLAAATAAAAPTALARTCEALAGRFLIGLGAPAESVFDSAMGVLKFVAAVFLATAVGAALGLAAEGVLATADWTAFLPRAAEWSLRDAAGALVIAPAAALWLISDPHDRGLKHALTSAAAFVGAGAVGALAFSPLFDWTPQVMAVLAFVSVVPVLGTVLCCSRRDAATVVLILSAFAAWSALAGTAPFLRGSPELLFAPLVLFVLGMSVTALAVSAELAARERDAERMRQQEKNLRALFAVAPIGVAQADAGGRFTAVNDRLCWILQRPPAELARMRLQDIGQVEELPRPHRLEPGTRGGEAFTIESAYTRPDGTVAQLSTSVAPVPDFGGAAPRLVVVTQDVTAQRQAEDELRRVRDELRRLLERSTVALEETNTVLGAETEKRKRAESALEREVEELEKVGQALAESERRFRVFVHGVHDYAIFMLTPDGYITEWNLGAQRIHGYTGLEVIGRHFSHFYLEEEQQRGEPARALQVAAYEGAYLAEGWRVRRDDTRLWASVAIEAIRDEAGALVAFAHITRDITERRQAQQSLERAQQQLAQSQKMEALGQLTGSIAHDFNNLLMIVSGHAQLLRRRLSDPKHLQAVDAVHTAANRGESLTRQLLAFSRRQPLNPVVIDPNERIEAVREMLTGSLRGNIELRCDIPDDVWRIEVDVAELELAFVNLVVNARDAMPGGGSITLSAKNVTLTKSDEIDELEGDFVDITLTDTGVGIAPDVLPRIFEPFYTTKEFGKGTGLGLSQVYGFSRQSGGTVTAASTVGSGTAITIYLPRSHAAATETPKPAVVASDAPAHGTVLVVEDNLEVAEVTVSLIEQLGYRAVGAENASEALARLRKGPKIDLVLSDVVMPGSMNGFALAHEIRKYYPDIPVLLTSGYSDVVQSATPRAPILRKPFQLAALGKALREAQERRGGAPEPSGRIVPFSQTRAPTNGVVNSLG